MTTIFSTPNSFNAEIVRENSAISGLEDGKVYVLAARTDLFVDAVKTAIKHFKNLMDNREGLIYHYDISVIENVVRQDIEFPAIGSVCLFDGLLITLKEQFDDLRIFHLVHSFLFCSSP